MKIIVGAGEVVRDGWLSLQHSDLDIREARHGATAHHQTIAAPMV